MEDSPSKLNEIQSEIEKYKLHGYVWTLDSVDTMREKPSDDTELNDKVLKRMFQKNLENISESNLPKTIEFDNEEDKSYIKNLKIESFKHYKVNENFLYKPEAVYKTEYNNIKRGNGQLIAQLILYYNSFLSGDKTKEKYTETHNLIFNHTAVHIGQYPNVNDLLKKYIKQILELFINEQNVSSDIKYMSIYDYNAEYFGEENQSKYKSIDEQIFSNNMLNARKEPPPKPQQPPESILRAAAVPTISTEEAAPTISTEEAAPPVVVAPAVPKQVVSENPKEEEENNEKEFNELNEKYKGVPGLKTEKYTKQHFDDNKKLIKEYDMKFNNLYIYLRNLCHGIIYEKYIDVDGDAQWEEYKEKNIKYKNSKPQKYTKYIHILIYLEILRILSVPDNQDDLAKDIKEKDINHIKNILKILKEFYNLQTTHESFIINKIMSQKEKKEEEKKEEEKKEEEKKEEEKIVISHKKKIKIDNLLKLQYISDEISPQLDKSQELKGGAADELNDEDIKNVNEFNLYHPLIKELLGEYFDETNMSEKKIKKKEISTNTATAIQEPPDELKETPNSEEPNKKDKESMFEKFKNMTMNMINKEKNPALEEKKGEDMKRELEKKSKNLSKQLMMLKNVWMMGMRI